MRVQIKYLYDSAYTQMLVLAHVGIINGVFKCCMRNRVRLVASLVDLHIQKKKVFLESPEAWILGDCSCFKPHESVVRI